MYDKLLHIGLTMTEAKLYVMLLELGKAQAGILSRKTGIHRRSVYDALDRLIEKGLVSYIKENDKRYYLPTDPKRVQEIIDEQKNEVYDIMPALQARFMEHAGKQETLFYRGLEGIKTIFEDQIRDGKEVYIIGASHQAKELLKFYISHYTDKRVKRKIKLHAIYAGERHSTAVPLSEVRYLPPSFASLVSTSIYGDKVAIVVWMQEPVGILIKQPEVAKAFKNYFELLWKMGK
ncbi:MAG TPA: helix-turn-helix domain-containing protein [Candidatus Nanoarchaeia archaeon]|nr:helix-turn-helix domain-containing protein [Candidatus Nanoarchaeia archaeon]